MLKHIRNWKFIFLFTLLVLYLVYLGVVYKNELELPSEEWSRNLLLTEFKVDSINEVMSNNNIFSLPILDTNTFLTFWFQDNTINYIETDTKGSIVSKDKLNLNTKSIKKIRGILNNEIVSLYSLENKKLERYDINIQTKEIISTKLIAQSVKDFVVKDDLLIYSDDNNLNFIDITGHLERLENINAQRFEIIKDDNNSLYHIVVAEKTNLGENFINYITYDLSNKDLSKYRLTSIANSIKLSLNRVDIGIVNNNINILTSVADNRFSVNTLYLFKFSQNDPINFSKNKLNISSLKSSLKPDIHILKDERVALTFIASGNIIKGRDTETLNLFKYTLDSKGNVSKEKLLTKTNSTTLNPYYFSLDNNNYLVSTDINGKSKRILLSSNNTDLIKASKKLTKSEIIDLFMATFTSLVPTVFISLISVMNIFVPVILFIFIISVINLRLIENYSKIMFIFILTLHSILKIFYSNNYILKNYEVHNFLPDFLKNPLSLYILLLAATLISIYCLKSFLENSKNRKHLVKSYSFFAFIDLAIYTFLTTPYVYSYLLLTYKINLK